MKFRNYCIVVLGNTNGVKFEIFKVSETPPRLLDENGIFIATFQSVLIPRELTDYFISLNHNFMLFDMDDRVSGVNITNKKLHDGLFGAILGESKDNLSNQSNRLLNEIKNSVDTGMTKDYEAETIVEKPEESEESEEVDYSHLSSKAKENIINNLLDKGVENLTEKDKETLKNLSKK